MSSKITRRQLAAAVSASAASLAQQTPPIPQNPDEELKAARDQNHQSAAQLAKFELAMAIEPAVHFKA